MSRSETEIPIIEVGWRHYERIVDSAILQLPNPSILHRLIRFPRNTYINNISDEIYFDQYNLDEHRIRPQIFDRESQLLLQERSNLLVDRLLNQPLTTYELSIVNWCNEKNINPEVAIYNKKLVDYCDYILPEINSNTKTDRKLLSQLIALKPIQHPGWKGYYSMPTGSAKNTPAWTYFKKRRKKLDALVNRFPEYRHAYSYIEDMTKEWDVDHHRTLVFDEYDQVNLFNGRADRLKEKQQKGNIQVDSKILSQCLFCYRFWYQKSKSNPSRYCTHKKCISKNNAWEKSIEGSHYIRQSEVSLSGF
jgi:hypothetical protein